MKLTPEVDLIDRDNPALAVSDLINKIVRAEQAVGRNKLARVAHASQVKISALEQRMLVELGVREPLSMTDLVAALGHDKSQVSRGLRHLLETDLIQRESRRSPLRLSSGGQAFHRRAMDEAVQSNERLLQGLSIDDRTWMTTQIVALTRKAAALLSDERGADSAASDDPGEPREPDLPVVGVAVLPEMIIPQLLTLRALLQRSSFLAFKRLVNLSNFESVVFTHIWNNAPLATKELSRLTGRSKIQLDRVTAHLSDIQLVHRYRSGPRQDWMLDRKTGAYGTYRQLVEEGGRREASLTAGLRPRELDRLREILMQVAANAADMLEALST